MTIIEGQIIYARTTQAVPARLIFPQGWQRGQPLQCGIGKAQTTEHIASISPPEGQRQRLITLQNGNKFYCEARLFPEFLEEGRWASRLDKAERASWWVLSLIAVIATAVIGGFLYVALPKLADIASEAVPDSVIATLSEETLNTLDRFFVEETKLSEERQADLTAKFRELRDITGVGDGVELIFRSSPLLGPNALALPGGPIILIDELVEIAPSEDGLMGVLAHELAHISQRHNRKNLMRGAFVSLIGYLSGFTQADGQQSELLSALVFSGYSREFEAEADEIARQWMEEAGLDMAAFDEMLVALYKTSCGDNCDDVQTGWFDSHPSLTDRLSLQAQ